MSQFFCHHPEFGGGGWGHPLPDDPHPGPHACCIIHCPHASEDARQRAMAESAPRWIRVESGTLANRPGKFFARLDEHTRQPEQRERVVAWDGDVAMLCLPLVPHDNRAYLVHLADEERGLRADRLIASRRPFIERHASDLNRLARQAGWKIAGWSVYLDATEPTHSVVRIVISDEWVSHHSMLSRELPAARMGEVLGEPVSILSEDHWWKREPNAYGPFQPWPEEADDA